MSDKGTLTYRPGEYRSTQSRSPFDVIAETRAIKQQKDAEAAAALMPPVATGPSSMMKYIVIGAAVLGLVLFLKKRKKAE